MGSGGGRGGLQAQLPDRCVLDGEIVIVSSENLGTASVR